MLLALFVVLVLDTLSSNALLDPITEDSRKEANEILRTLDTEIYCANKKYHLKSHCVKNSAINDLRMVRIDSTEERLRCGITLKVTGNTA